MQVQQDLQARSYRETSRRVVQVWGFLFSIDASKRKYENPRSSPSSSSSFSFSLPALSISLPAHISLLFSFLKLLSLLSLFWMTFSFPLIKLAVHLVVSDLSISLHFLYYFFVFSSFFFYFDNFSSLC